MNTFIALCSVVMIAAGNQAVAADSAAPAGATASGKATAPTTTGKKADPAPAAKSAPSQLGMSVTGTQDSPKVLYIVPWKTIDAVPAEPYVSGLLDEVFAPVDPVEFERSVHQHQQLQTPAAAGVGP